MQKLLCTIYDEVYSAQVYSTTILLASALCRKLSLSALGAPFRSLLCQLKLLQKTVFTTRCGSFCPLNMFFFLSAFLRHCAILMFVFLAARFILFFMFLSSFMYILKVCKCMDMRRGVNPMTPQSTNGYFLGGYNVRYCRE